MTTTLASLTPLERRLIEEAPLTAFEQQLDLREAARLRELEYLRRQGRLSEAEAQRQALETIPQAVQGLIGGDGMIDVVEVQRRGVPELVSRSIGIPQESLAQATRLLEEVPRAVPLEVQQGPPVAPLAVSAQVQTERPSTPQPPEADISLQQLSPSQRTEFDQLLRQARAAPFQELANAEPGSNLEQEQRLMSARLALRRSELIQNINSRRQGLSLEVEGAQNSVRAWQRALGRSYMERAGGDLNRAAQLFLTDYPYQDYLISFEEARRRVQSDYQGQQGFLQEAQNNLTAAQSRLAAFDAVSSRITRAFDDETNRAFVALEQRVTGREPFAGPPPQFTLGQVLQMDPATRERFGITAPPPTAFYELVNRQGEVVARTGDLAGVRAAEAQGFTVRTQEEGIRSRLAPYQTEGGVDLVRAIEERAITEQEARLIFQAEDVQRTVQSVAERSVQQDILSRLAPHQIEGGYDLRAALVQDAITEAEARRLFPGAAVDEAVRPPVVLEEELLATGAPQQTAALAELQRQGFVSIEQGQVAVDVVRAGQAGQRALLEQVGFSPEFVQQQITLYQSDVEELQREIEAERRFGSEAEARNAAMAQLIQFGLASRSGEIDIVRALQSPENRDPLLLQAGFTPGQLAAYRREIAFLASGEPTGVPRLRFEPYQVILATPEARQAALERRQQIDAELYGLRGVVRQVDEGLRGPEVRITLDRTMNQLSEEKAELERRILDSLPIITQKYRQLGVPSALIPALVVGEVASTTAKLTPGPPPAKGAVAVSAALISATLLANYLADRPDLDDATRRALEEQLATTQREILPPAMISPPGRPLIRAPASLGGFAVGQPPSLVEVAPRAVPRGLTELPPFQPPTVEVVRVFQAATAVLDAEKRVRDSAPLIPASVDEFLRRPTVAEPLDVAIDRALAQVEENRRSSLRRDLEDLARKRQVLEEARQTLVASQGFPPEQSKDLSVLSVAVSGAATPQLLGGTTPARGPQAVPSTPLRGTPDRPDPRDLPEPGILPPAIGIPLTEQAAVAAITELNRLQQRNAFPLRQMALSNSLQTSFILNPGLRAAAASRVSPALAQYADTARLAQVSSQAQTQARIGTRTATAPLSRIRVPARVGTRVASAAAVAAPAIPAVAALAIPAIAAPVIRAPSPSRLAKLTTPRLVRGLHPQRVAFNTGATDLEVNLPTSARTWHSDLAEVPEIPAEESFTVLEKGLRPSPPRDFPMGKAQVSISGQGVKFKGRKTAKKVRVLKGRTRKITYDSPG